MSRVMSFCLHLERVQTVLRVEHLSSDQDQQIHVSKPVIVKGRSKQSVVAACKHDDLLKESQEPSFW